MHFTKQGSARTLWRSIPLLLVGKAREEHKEISSGPIKVHNSLQPPQCFSVSRVHLRGKM
jgi:hypothetical protein